MPWRPGDAWPSGTAGGAASPHWGGYVRLWVRAALAPGDPFTLGPHAGDRLDDGNVLGGAPAGPLGRGGRAGAGALWVDLSCDVLDVDIQGGAQATDGIFTKPDAATAVVNLADPTRKYDPLNNDSPWQLGGRSRLVPGTPVDVFAEVVNGDDGTWTREWLFSGSADSWGEDWTPKPRDRVAQLIASGESKSFVNMKRPATDPPVGAGETTAQRVQRIVDLAGWLGTIDAGVGTTTHGPTALDSDGWDLLNRTLDDELGFVYFTNTGDLRWLGRDAWFDLSHPPALELGCGLHDVLVDASPAAIDLQIRNSVYAARTDGVVAHALSTSSVNRYGRYDYERTDLGLDTDAQAADWAATALRLYAFPQISLADVTFRPAIDARSWEVWAAALAVAFVSDLVHVVWSPPDRPADDPIDARCRVVGFHHVISRRSWDLTWELVDADALAYNGAIFTLGPNANDRLDSAFVLA